MAHGASVSVVKEDTWDEWGGERGEEGEVFTLRVPIHYTKAKAHSVTLSPRSHLYTTRKVTSHLHCAASNTNTHTRAFTQIQPDTLPICRPIAGYSLLLPHKHR